MRKTSRLILSEDGVSTIEFAFVATVLSTLLLGIIDFGVGFWQQMELANAVYAGAKYVMSNGYDSASVSTAVTSATNLSGISASSSTACGCPTASGVQLVSGSYPSCGSSCSSVTGGIGTSVPYVTVSGAVSYSTLFSWPGISNPMTLNATAVASN